MHRGAVLQCPRCGYSGQGVPYFSRASNLGLLVGVSLFTYAIGGLVYWVARRKHRVCQNCGLSWEKVARSGLLPTQDGDGERKGRALPPEREKELLPSAGVKRRVLGAALLLFGTFLILMGVVEAEAAAIVFGSVVGVAGSGTFYWGVKAQQARRQALMSGLQRQVLRLATRNGGVLTVTEVAAELNLSIPVAEKVLIQMDDGFRVRSDITPEGVIVYEFPEVQLRGRLAEGGEAGQSARPA